jgi:hypothetical protein
MHFLKEGRRREREDIDLDTYQLQHNHIRPLQIIQLSPLTETVF